MIKRSYLIVLLLSFLFFSLKLYSFSEEELKRNKVCLLILEGYFNDFQPTEPEDINGQKEVLLALKNDERRKGFTNNPKSFTSFLVKNNQKGASKKFQNLLNEPIEMYSSYSLLMELLTTNENYGGFFKTIKESPPLVNDIRSIFNNENTEKQIIEFEKTNSSLKAENQQLNSIISNLKLELEESNVFYKSTWFILLLVILIILMITLNIILIFKRNELIGEIERIREGVSDKEQEIKWLKMKPNENRNGANKEIKKLNEIIEQKNSQLEKLIKTKNYLEKQIPQEKSKIEFSKTLEESSNNFSEKKEIKSTRQFFSPPPKKQEFEVSKLTQSKTDISIYTIEINQEKEKGTFQIIIDDISITSKALYLVTDYINPGCQILEKSGKPTKIIIKEQGEIEAVGDAWKIIKKCKVVLE